MTFEWIFLMIVERLENSDECNGQVLKFYEGEQ